LISIVRWLSPFANGLGLGILAMLLHECGHLLASFALGVRVKNVGVKWDKGFYIVRVRGTVYQNLVIALAGPLGNLLLIGAAPWPSPFALANVCYALANLLPIDGSDGSRIASCLRQIRSGEVSN
jgi:Zn-dependent protease